MIARLQTPRNRELGNLLVVALLVVTGFGAVFIARENSVSTASLTYADGRLYLYSADEGETVLLDASPQG